MDAIVSDSTSFDLDALLSTEDPLPVIDISPQGRAFALNVVHGYVATLKSPELTTETAYTIAMLMPEAAAKAGVTISNKQRLEFGLDDDMPCSRPAYRYVVNGEETQPVAYVFQAPKPYQHKPPQP